MKLMLVFIFAVTFSIVKAQTNELKPDYEALTFRLFNEGKWDSLLIKGREAIKSGSDYFYILTRTGIAAYNLKKYALASFYLEKARELNAFDNYTNEILFYSYIYTTRNYSAMLLTKNIDYGDSLYSDYIHPVYYMEGGFLTSRDVSKHGEQQIIKETEYTYKEQFKEKNGLYFLTGWKQPLGRRSLLNAAFSFTDYNKERNITIRKYDSLSGSYKVKQSEFYLAPSYIASSRLVITPVIRYAMIVVSEPFSQNDSSKMIYPETPIGTSYFNYVLGSELNYYRNYFHATLGLWLLDINNDNSYQSSASIMILPLGNTDLYSGSAITWKNKRPSGPFVFSQMLGLRLHKHKWLELSYTNGNLSGTVENNAQLMNNQIAESDYRLTALLIADISRHIRLNLRCEYLKSNGTIYYTDIENVLMNQNYKFSQQILTGGLTWNIF